MDDGAWQGELKIGIFQVCYIKVGSRVFTLHGHVFGMYFPLYWLNLLPKVLVLEKF